MGALSRQHFDAVDRRTDGDVADRQRVPGTDRGFDTRDQRCAYFQTARGDDVAALTVGIAQECNVRGTVRVVFETLDLGRDPILVATEVNQAIVLLVTAATMADRDVAVVVTARTTDLLFK